MKLTYQLLLSICIFFIGSIFAENLIINPSFEEQRPGFWSSMNGTVGNELIWESDVVYEGFHSFKITKSSAMSSAVGWVSDNNANLYWNNAGDGTYEISGIVKTVGVNTSPANDDAMIGIVFEFKDASGNEIMTETIWADQSVSSKDWEQLAGVAVLTEAPASVVIKLLMGKYATGTVYFDNISCNTTDSWSMWIFNGDAETIHGWLNWYLSDNGSYGIVTDNTANTGNYSAELFKPETSSSSAEIVYYSIPVPVEAGEWYKVGVWVKTQGVNTDESFEPTYITTERLDDRLGLCYFFHTGDIDHGWSLSGGEKFVYVDQTTADKEWTHYVVAEKAPDDATGISVRARFTSYPTGKSWFDDFSVEKIIEYGDQLIQNPSFEDQIPAFWNELNGTIGNELGVEPTVVYDGFCSFKITKSNITSNNVGWISDNNANLYWNNAGDGTYEISGMVKTVGVNTSPANDDAKIGVVFEFKNASGAELVTETLWADQTVAFKDWDELTGAAILTEAPTSVVVKLIMGKDATGTVYFDNISCGTTPSWTMMVFNHGAETVDDWMVWYASDNGSYGIVTDNTANTGNYSAELFKPETSSSSAEIVYY
ncbi:hypothetical protein KKA87_17430, partial [bacterium]|nr:hypothetical protein [bacterium]